ncbi:MAG: hypothetical protein EA382_08145 [Spirochaetaceae bacterium]|nr:MAG: hypothetical protein EA382_08145 [Spirochaetaceae bacterium]
MVLILALAVFAAAPSFAQFRADFGVLIPWRIGAAAQSGDESANDSFDVLQFATLPFPELMVSYSGKVGPITVGGGLRGFSIILQSLFWPVVYAEAELGPAVVHLNLGGGAFWTFGVIGNALETGGIFIPDLSAYFKLGRSFRLGLGVASIRGIDFDPELTITPWVFYISGKFVTMF